MGKREIPRGLRDVADLLKHPAISQEVKQQLLAQLSPEDLAAIGYKPPKPTLVIPAVQPTALVEPRQVSTPPPLKLVTSWPVMVLELEPDTCEDEELEEEEATAARSGLTQPVCAMAPTSWGSMFVVEVMLLWPVLVTASSLILLATVMINLLAANV